MIRGFVVKVIYADRAFESCKTELSEQGITLLCCDTNSHVHFIEQGIRFVKERVRCVRSMLPQEIKRIPTRLMREFIVSTVKMINSIRRKRGVHPVMSPRQIITGRRMVLPPYPPGSCVYAVKGIPLTALTRRGPSRLYTYVLTMKVVDILYITSTLRREVLYVELLE